jgi:hypothetical protein
LREGDAVTEQEWLGCTFPARQLEHLRARGLATDRQLRALACACLRLVWARLAAPSVRAAVEVAERLVSGEVGREELDAAREAAAPGAMQISRSFWFRDEPTSRDVWYHVALHPTGQSLGMVVAHYTWVSSTLRSWFAFRTQRRETALLHEVFGNPFRPLPRSARSRLCRSDGLIVTLAQAAYEERSMPSGHLDPARLAVLADADEEAGGAHEDMLRHLRQQGQAPVRGGWAVDLLLGKA